MQIAGVLTLRDYRKYLRSFLARKRMIQQSYAIQVNLETDYKGIVKADKGFTFKGGAELRFQEKVEIIDRVIHIVEYSYGYTRPDGWYFRYDKDPDRAKPHIHPLNHLHVNADDPRFPTHDANFEEIIEFILAAYYP